MNFTYTLYQVEHVRTARQQREEDNRAGELAADFGRVWHSLAHPRAGRQRSFRQAAETGSARTVCCPATGPHAICG
jgi:hypothetical protein